MPQVSPTGMAISPATDTIYKVPTMACAIPPPISPTGFGISRKKFQLMDAMPLEKTNLITKKSGSKTIIAQKYNAKWKIRFFNFLKR
jgi:hypothetical protein